jgi:hypothetical protein
MVRHKSVTPLWILFLGSVIFMVGLMLPNTAGAQCGSSASSCKNCHEVQAQYPVNASGNWHISHAFGDFCEFCHAGNVQAVDKDTAHVGLVYPLEDINTNCLSCHPNDVNEKAEVYAAALGVTAGSGPGSDSPPGTTGDEPTAADNQTIDGDQAPGDQATEAESNAPAEEPAAPSTEAANDGTIIDFNRQYEVTVENASEPVNRGNTILVILALGLATLGGFLVWRWEGLGEKWRELRQRPATIGLKTAGAAVLTAPIPLTQPAAPPVARPGPQVQAVPLSVVAEERPETAALLALLSAVDSNTLAALTKLVERPQGWPVIQAVAQLDPRLVAAVRQLDPTDRELLMALVKEMDRE